MPSREDQIFEQLARKNLALADDRIQAAYRRQGELQGGGRASTLADCLVETGALTPKHVKVLRGGVEYSLERERGKKFVRRAVRKSFITQDQADRALAQQSALFSRNKVLQTLDRILVSDGVLSQKQADSIWAEYHQWEQRAGSPPESVAAPPPSPAPTAQQPPSHPITNPLASEDEEEVWDEDAQESTPPPRVAPKAGVVPASRAGAFDPALDETDHEGPAPSLTDDRLPLEEAEGVADPELSLGGDDPFADASEEAPRTLSLDDDDEGSAFEAVDDEAFEAVDEDEPSLRDEALDESPDPMSDELSLCDDAREEAPDPLGDDLPLRDAGEEFAAQGDAPPTGGDDDLFSLRDDEATAPGDDELTLTPPPTDDDLEPFPPPAGSGDRDDEFEPLDDALDLAGADAEDDLLTLGADEPDALLTDSDPNEATDPEGEFELLDDARGQARVESPSGPQGDTRERDDSDEEALTESDAARAAHDLDDLDDDQAATDPESEFQLLDEDPKRDDDDPFVLDDDDRAGEPSASKPRAFEDDQDDRNAADPEGLEEVDDLDGERQVAARSLRDVLPNAEQFETLLEAAPLPDGKAGAVARELAGALYAIALDSLDEYADDPEAFARDPKLLDKVGEQIKAALGEVAADKAADIAAEQSGGKIPKIALKALVKPATRAATDFVWDTIAAKLGQAFPSQEAASGDDQAGDFEFLDAEEDAPAKKPAFLDDDEEDATPSDAPTPDEPLALPTAAPGIAWSNLAQMLAATLLIAGFLLPLANFRTLVPEGSWRGVGLVSGLEATLASAQGGWAALDATLQACANADPAAWGAADRERLASLLGFLPALAAALGLLLGVRFLVFTRSKPSVLGLTLLHALGGAVVTLPALIFVLAAGPAAEWGAFCLLAGGAVALLGTFTGLSKRGLALKLGLAVVIIAGVFGGYFAAKSTLVEQFPPLSATL